MKDFRKIPPEDWFLAILSGVMLALSFPKPDLSFLAWIAFVPLLLACARHSTGAAFRLGFVAGLTAYCGILYWINIAVTSYGHLPWLVSILIFLGLASYLALYPALTVALVRRGADHGITPLLSFPVAWTCFEYVRSFLLTGFPWASLGYTQYRLLPLIQVADITGIYGISFVICFANVVVYRFLRGAVTGEKRAWPVRSAIVLALVLAGVLAYGYRCLHRPETGTPVKVAMIQGNIDQDVKWNPAFQSATLSVYERLSRKACSLGSDLTVWPESAAPFFLQDEAVFAGRISVLAKETGSCLLVGSPAHERRSEEQKYLNSAFLLSPQGQVMGRTDKVHLVPFGEYVPLGKYFPFINKIVAGIGDFSPGDSISPLDTGKGKIGVLICYEGIFPELARAYVLAGSQILVNITNDAWYKRSSAPYQHVAMTVFRAIENRVPLVRAANTGVSAIIDSRGRIKGQTNIFEEAVLTGEVRPGSGSFYTRHGDLFAWACSIATMAVLVASLMRRKRH